MNGDTVDACVPTRVTTAKKRSSTRKPEKGSTHLRPVLRSLLTPTVRTEEPFVKFVGHLPPTESLQVFIDPLSFPNSFPNEENPALLGT